MFWNILSILITDYNGKYITCYRFYRYMHMNKTSFTFKFMKLCWRKCYANNKLTPQFEYHDIYCNLYIWIHVRSTWNRLRTHYALMFLKQCTVWSMTQFKLQHEVFHQIGYRFFISNSYQSRTSMERIYQSGRSPKVVALFLLLTLVAILYNYFNCMI